MTWSSGSATPRRCRRRCQSTSCAGFTDPSAVAFVEHLEVDHLDADAALKSCWRRSRPASTAATPVSMQPCCASSSRCGRAPQDDAHAGAEATSTSCGCRRAQPVGHEKRWIEAGAVYFGLEWHEVGRLSRPPTARSARPSSSAAEPPPDGATPLGGGILRHPRRGIDARTTALDTPLAHYAQWRDAPEVNAAWACPTGIRRPVSAPPVR